MNVAHFGDRTTGHPYEPEEPGIGDQESEVGTRSQHMQPCEGNQLIIEHSNAEWIDSPLTY